MPTSGQETQSLGWKTTVCDLKGQPGVHLVSTPLPRINTHKESMSYCECEPLRQQSSAAHTFTWMTSPPSNHGSNSLAAAPTTRLDRKGLFGPSCFSLLNLARHTHTKTTLSAGVSARVHRYDGVRLFEQVALLLGALCLLLPSDWPAKGGVGGASFMVS